MGGDSYGDHEETEDELFDAGWRCGIGGAVLAMFLAGFVWSVGLYARFHEEESRRGSKG